MTPASDTTWDIPHVTGHILSFGSVIMSFVGLIPVFAALAGFVFYMIQIYESATVQKWLDRRRMLWKARRISTLRAEQKVLMAELDGLEIVRDARAVAENKVAVAAHEAAKMKQGVDLHD